MKECRLEHRQILVVMRRESPPRHTPPLFFVNVVQICFNPACEEKYDNFTVVLFHTQFLSLISHFLCLFVLLQIDGAGEKSACVWLKDRACSSTSVVFLVYNKTSETKVLL